MSDHEYVAKLAEAGFDNIDIEPTLAVASVPSWLIHYGVERTASFGGITAPGLRKIAILAEARAEADLCRVLISFTSGRG